MEFTYKGNYHIACRKKVQGKLDGDTVTIVIVGHELAISPGQVLQEPCCEIVKFAVVDGSRYGGVYMGQLDRATRTISCVSGTHWDASAVRIIIAKKAAA